MGKQNNSMGFKPNAMLWANDPNKSIMSLNSVALEKINQRNADRLLKLDNDNDLNNSAFYNSMSAKSLKPQSDKHAKPRAGWDTKGKLPPKPVQRE